MTNDIRKLKVLIGIPTRGQMQGDTAICLGFMIYTLGSEPVIRVDGQPTMLLWNILKVSSSVLPQSRQDIVDAALKNEVDFLLFLDDDMTFSERILHEWIAENRPVIAANCPTRGVPCFATARKSNPRDPFKGDVIYSDVANMRWERVWRVGTGIMLLRKDALRSLPRPAFTPRWEPGNDHYVGEDWVMCEHLEAAGIPIVVDHHLSLTVGHIGEQKFTHEMAAGTRQAIARKSGTIAHGADVPNSPLLLPPELE